MAVDGASYPEGGPDSRTKVLFIAGWMRSGSTLLDTLLGEFDGFLSTGELASFWSRGLIKGRQCGCGAKIIDCPLWSQVLDGMYEGRKEAIEDARRTMLAQDRAVRLRYFPRLLAQRQHRTPTWGPLRCYLGATGRLYRTMREITGKRVIVNSSKLPQEAALLPLLPNVDPYLLHLVRDPRAVAYSMSRTAMLQTSPSDPVRMPRASAASSAVGWTRINLGTEMARLRYDPGHTKVVRYEDLTERPLDTLASIAEFVGEPHLGIEVEGENTIELHGNHTVWGNAARFKRGPVRIRQDDEWMKKLSPSNRVVVTMLASPLLIRYGYSFATG